MINSSFSASGPAELFRNTTVRMRSYDSLVNNYRNVSRGNSTSVYSLLQIHHLREALSALRPGQIRSASASISAVAASASSSAPLDFGNGLPAQLRSTEEINTAPTSFQHQGPAWIGSTATAPWSGRGSTAAASVSGTYDGSDGMGVLTFKVVRAGTHGEDDLRIKVLAENGSTVETINIGSADPLNRVYQLSNGLEITLGEGDLVKNDFFEVDVSVLSTSYTPNDPDWTGSTATPAIGGQYQGNNGTGELTFRVVRGGVHGEDDLRIKVYGPDGGYIERIDVKRNDPIDKVYNLSNGLTFSLGEGTLIKNETFQVEVDAGDPDNFTTDPVWNFSSSTATLTGTYDGSNGNQTLTFRILDTGVVGEDDLRVRVMRENGSTLETINISKDNPVDTAYELSNGLSVTFSAGNMIRNETFTVDVESAGSFSTDPNPVESTAVPALHGVYDGSLGTDVLQFTVTQSGTRGTDDLAFEVRTSSGTLVDTINILATDPLDQSYGLSSGLVLSLGAGSLALNETFDVSISHLIPTSVDPNLSFNGTGVNDPRLEDQYTIVDGNFEINGTQIAVFANDSIMSVLGRINDANIDVVANFDHATETIVLTHEQTGSEHDIVLSNDTSGFLAATKLMDAVATSGGDETTVLADLELASGVSNGDLTINGVAVGIDVDVDSLEDVLYRIDASLPTVDVDFDSVSGRVSLTTIGTSDLQISSGGTGFFEAIGIAEGLYRYQEARSGPTREQGFSYQVRRDTARAVTRFAKRFNAVFENQYLPPGENNSYIENIREELKNAISEAFSAQDLAESTEIGIPFDFSSDNQVSVNISDSFRSDLENRLRTSAGAQQFNMLFSTTDQSNPGLIERMLEIVDAAERELGRELGGTGRIFNIYA